MVVEGCSNLSVLDTGQDDTRPSGSKPSKPKLARPRIKRPLILPEAEYDLAYHDTCFFVNGKGWNDGMSFEYLKIN